MQTKAQAAPAPIQVQSTQVIPDTCRASDASAPGDHYPLYDPRTKYETSVASGLAQYVDFIGAGTLTYAKYINQHTWNGKYFNYDVTRDYSGNPAVVIFDAKGLPKVNYAPVPEANYKGGYEYNPTTLAQFALMAHARYLDGKANQLPLFLNAVDKLISMQDAKGGFEYPFPYHHFQNSKPYLPGWISAISQGQALSALARAYDVTGDAKYLNARNKALAVLLTPIAQGGSRNTLFALDPSLTNYAIFEEYPVIAPDTKSNYTVNGFMHVLIGLYDWSNVTSAGASADSARTYFRCGLTTLKKVVPYADLNGFSAYDLGHIIYGRDPKVHPSYHETHVYMLYTLYLMTKDQWFLIWAKKWARNIDPTYARYTPPQ
ncbi:D-glucuronyl C5-epimerase family protein [Cupriavidus sp. CV2]|uniref:D-glucuronyl C5-epimerase family protein n=1 Tax=Cupriavidus ulmosensis TaxID=3065913 RepID=UPI00296AFC55|nr:D-glucuronyl C5-epimerase family protein [Cupriavidus sp. CV2]MDW3683121.1 D-glucuronyl C5-epimerase family protein [Cupriavidus sp. CV2]